LGKGQKKIKRLLNDAKKEINTPEPGKEEIGSALGRVIKLVNDAGKLADNVKTQLIPVAKNIGQWLGKYGETRIEFFL